MKLLIMHCSYGSSHVWMIQVLSPTEVWAKKNKEEQRGKERHLRREKESSGPYPVIHLSMDSSHLTGLDYQPARKFNYILPQPGKIRCPRSK